MIESNLVEGKQGIAAPSELVYGQSVTDACLGWQDSLDCLAQLAEANAHRLRQCV